MKSARIQLGVRWRAILFASLFALACFGWQNCSNVGITAMPSVVEPKSLGLKASVCSQMESQGLTSGNFLFVVDMSSSNVGSWFNVGQFWYFDVTKATDAFGARFDAITYFLNNCGNKPNAKFAVIGFSDGAGVLNGTGGTTTFGCTGIKFGNASAAQAEIDALKREQTLEAPWYAQWTQSTNNYLTATAQEPPILRGTSYTNALKCADQIVVDDLTQSGGSSADAFHVVFMSDGSPADQKGIGCNQPSSSADQKQACYLQSVDDNASKIRQSALAMGRDLRLYGIFYGQTESTVPVAMTRIAIDGATGTPMSLNSFSGNQDALCKMVGAQLNVNFKPDSFISVNLTTLGRDGKLLADSDMDGIPDEEEEALGFDPLDPRSRVSGVLDGICRKLGGVAECQARRQAITCDPNKFINLLTECDYKILGLDATTALSPGVDTDKDTLPDFIEIIKGTDAAKADAGGDPDGDAMPNQREIAEGTDPFSQDTNIPTKNRNSFSTAFRPDLAVCGPSGGYELKVTQTQTSPTKAITKWPIAGLNHAAGGQVLWLGYRIVPVNGSNQTIRYYWKLVQTRALGPDVGQQALSGPEFLDTDFELLGKVMP